MNTTGAFVAGSIVGKLLLDKTGWNASIKSVDKDTSDLVKSAQKISEAHQKVGLMFTGVGLAVVGSLAAMVKKTADFGDKLFDLSQITGISAATLSSFKLAADKSGTSLEGVALGLRFLGRSMAAATAGTGAAGAAFKALGISVTDTSGKLRPMDDVMMEVADRFASMENGAQKTALAIKLFGRSGSELIPFLNLGRAGLGELRKEAERLGIVMSDTDAAASDKFNDALVSLQGSVQGVGMAIGKILLPAAQGLADALTRAASGVTEAMNKNGAFTQTLVEMSGVFGVVATAAGGFHLALALGLKVMATTAAALQTTVGALAIATTAWTALATAVVFYILKLQELEAAKADLNRSDEAFWEMQGRIITKLQDVATVAGIHHDVMAELYNSYGVGNAALALQAIRLGQWESKFPGITAALEQVATKSREAYDKLKPPKTIPEGIADVRIEIEKLRPPIIDAAEAFRDLSNTSLGRLVSDMQAMEVFEMPEPNFDAAFKGLEIEAAGSAKVIESVLGESFEGAANASEIASKKIRESIASLTAGGTIGETKNKIAEIEIALTKTGLTAEKIRQLKDELARLKGVVADSTPWGKFLSGARDAFNQLSAAITPVIDQIQKNSTIAIENEYKRRLAYINKTVKNEEAKQAAITALEAEFQIKRTKQQASAAKMSKAIALAGATMNMAEAITAALTMKPWTPFNFVLAATTAALAAVQVGLIAAQPIPLAEGASFTKPTLLQNVLVGEKRPEYLLDKPKLTDIVRDALMMPRFMGAPAMAMAGAGGGGGTVTLNFNGPLVSSPGVSMRDLEAAGENLVVILDRQLKRVGRRL